MIMIFHPLRSLFRVEHLPEACLIAVVAGAASLGGSFGGFPDVYRRSPTFASTFGFADPFWWALALILPSIAIAICCVIRRAVALWPCLVLAVIFCLLGMSTVPTVTAGAGVPSAVIAYSLIGVLCCLIGAIAHFWDRRPAR